MLPPSPSDAYLPQSYRKPTPTPASSFPSLPYLIPFISTPPTPTTVLPHHHPATRHPLHPPHRPPTPHPAPDHIKYADVDISCIHPVAHSLPEPGVLVGDLSLGHNGYYTRLNNGRPCNAAPANNHSIATFLSPRFFLTLVSFTGAS